jgi:cytochrome c oxidase cbb3-type subunit 3
MFFKRTARSWGVVRGLKTRYFCLILLPGLLLAQDPDDVRGANTKTAAVQAGKAQFQQTCGFCHGKDGRGGASGPDLIRSTVLSHDVNGNLIGQIVHAGRPDRGMPAFQLSDSVISQIAAFLHSEANSAASVAREIPSDYPLDKLLVGNAQQGEAYFESHCAHCHSPAKDLAHIASKFKPFDLQTRIAFPTGAKPTAIVTDRAGKTFQGDVIYSDEFWISLRDKDGKTHTWSRNSASIRETDPLAQHARLLKELTDSDLHNVFAYLETLK